MNVAYEASRGEWSLSPNMDFACSCLADNDLDVGCPSSSDAEIEGD
jgi:hypothetical protein